MMDIALSRITDQSIQLELNTAQLYFLFHRVFPEHKAFWWALHIEENNHAALIRSAREHFVPTGRFPTDLLSSRLRELEETNANILALTGKYQRTPPTEEDAFNAALGLEASIGEIHFQQFMDKEEGSSLHKIFQRLNRDDKNHASRIRAYMDRHGIPVREDGLSSGPG
ncbi:MAG TPA: hypothetical protein ENI99_02700 [Sedimenticola sp.]|nr:hypothetical protein [Sedimenticola sp.]